MQKLLSDQRARLPAVLLSLLLLCCTPVLWAQSWSTQPFENIAVYPERHAPVQVEALNQAKLAAQSSGQIRAILVKIGDSVKQGQPLVKLDTADANIAVARAKAQIELLQNRLSLASAQLEQAQTLSAQGFFSDERLRARQTEQAVTRSELKAAQQALSAAQLQLSRSTVRAPFAGVVTARLASVGDLAVPGTLLIQLASSDQLQVSANVAELYLAGLKSASNRFLRFAGQADRAVDIVTILPLIEREGQRRRVMLSVPAGLTAGQAGELRWTLSQPHLPPAYLQQVEGVYGVWVARAGRAEFVPLSNAVLGHATMAPQLKGMLIIDQGRFGLANMPVSAQRPLPEMQQ